MPLRELAELGLVPAGQGIGEHEGVTLAGFGKQAIDFTYHAIDILTLAHQLSDGSLLSLYLSRF